MTTRLHQWLHNVTLHDPLEQRQAMPVQIMFLILIGLLLGEAIVVFLGTLTLTLKMLVGIIILLNIPFIVAAFILLRRDRFHNAILLATMSLIGMLSVLLLLAGIHHSSTLLFGFAIPITMAGLLAGRRGLLIASGLSLLSVMVVSFLETINVPLVGILPTDSDRTLSTISDFIVIVLVISFFLDRFHWTFRQTLLESRFRERELAEMRESLEYMVARRTRELQRALDEVQAQAVEQQRLLFENSQQREAIRELSVPVLPIAATTLVMPLIGALDSTRLMLLQERALHAIQRSTARYVLLDITGVLIIDSEVAQGLLQILRSARLLGAEVVLVGVRPEVASAIVRLGIDPGSIRAYSDLQTALRWLH